MRINGIATRRMPTRTSTKKLKKKNMGGMVHGRVRGKGGEHGLDGLDDLVRDLSMADILEKRGFLGGRRCCRA